MLPDVFDPRFLPDGLTLCLGLVYLYASSLDLECLWATIFSDFFLCLGLFCYCSVALCGIISVMSLSRIPMSSSSSSAANVCPVRVVSFVVSLIDTTLVCVFVFRS